MAPYLYPFNAALIPGTTQAKLIDDTFRNINSALIERFDDKLVEDATADPWVLKPEVSGLKVGKVRSIPFINFLATGGGGVTIFDDHIIAGPSSNPLYAGINLPAGTTVREVGMYIDSSGSISLEFYHITATPPFTKVSIAAWISSVAGQRISLNGTTLNHVVDPFHTYYVSADVTGSGSNSLSLYGGYILYDTPSHLNTI